LKKIKNFNLSVHLTDLRSPFTSELKPIRSK